MGRVNNQVSRRQQKRASMKKLRSLNQLELDYIQEKHIEGMLKWSLRKRIGFSLRLIFKRFKFNLPTNQEG